jgi:hypothetical protein
MTEIGDTGVGTRLEDSIVIAMLALASAKRDR